MYIYCCFPSSACVQNCWYPRIPLGKRRQESVWAKYYKVHFTHRCLLLLDKTSTQSFPNTHKASFVLRTYFGTISLTNLSSYASGQMLAVKVIISWLQYSWKILTDTFISLSAGESISKTGEEAAPDSTTGERNITLIKHLGSTAGFFNFCAFSF